MRFVYPELLWLLAALPLLGAATWWAAARRRRALRRFAGGEDFLPRFDVEVSVHRRVAKQLLLHAGLAALVVAAARPQWGTRLEPVTRRGVDVVVVLDHSLSMAADDLPPSRLARARHEVDSLLGELSGDRVALVTFAGEATLLCPLTLDHAAVRLFLDTVEAETVQVPGTALAEALRLGLATLGDSPEPGGERGRAIVLLTDGEDHEGGVDEVIEEIKRAGVAVYAIGCGTTRGSPIPVSDESGLRTGYKKDREGRVVTTRLDESILELLALDTGGRYHRATASEVEVGEIAQALSGMDAHEFGAVLRARYEERFQVPLALAVLALVADTLLGDRRRRRNGRHTAEVGR